VGNTEQFLDKAARSAITGGMDKPVNRVGLPQYMQSVPGTVPEISGQTIVQYFAIAEGEILKMFVQVRLGWGKLPKTGNVLLRVRANAAHQVLKFAMIDHPDVAFHEATVEGRFDVLTVEEAEAFGVHVPKAFHSGFEKHNVDRILTERIVLCEELAPATKFEQKTISDGETSKVVTVRKRRRVIE